MWQRWLYDFVENSGLARPRGKTDKHRWAEAWSYRARNLKLSWINRGKFLQSGLLVKSA
jgi:hypothetical protein